MRWSEETLRDAGWRPYEDQTFIGHIGSIYVRSRASGDEFGILTLPQHRNLSGVVHGGVMMALFDRAMGEIVRKVRAPEGFATATLTIDFLARVDVGDFISFSAAALKSGRRTMFMRGDARVAGTIVGSASGLFMATGRTVSI